ncbi:hypothetical protein [Bordetella sp. BOR01]|uniref:hypothetical protein n=1 Tax=Bordetella sp. BOR01 TaxID=2854779 RepID=UPI001C44F802|nr:hypothetical protein [Bordetella sp. BOR01]MBV7483376.1 hypothetical protein [Bordetella sp. BOR01]
MTDSVPDLDDLLAAVWPQASQVDPQRMADLVGEVRTIVQAARRAALDNAFDDEPSRFSATLHGLAGPDEAGNA